MEDALIYSSVIIDGTVCRICVFDHRNEKSSNGTLIEVKKPNYDINLIKIMVDTFNEIWIHSSPINQPSWKRLLCSKSVWLGLITVLGIVIFNASPGDSFIREITSNISLGCGSMLLGLSYEKIKEKIVYWYTRFTKINGEI